jgi:hypothetical protein
VSVSTTAESIRAEAKRRGVSLWQVRTDRGETKRPTADERSSLMVRMEPELHARLRDAAADRDLSMNYLATKAIKEFLDRLVPTDEFRLTR